jgi:hypothetical protein
MFGLVLFIIHNLMPLSIASCNESDTKPVECEILLILFYNLSVNTKKFIMGELTKKISDTERGLLIEIITKDSKKHG